MKPFITKKSLVSLGLFIASTVFTFGDQPDWWIDYSLVDNSTPPQDTAVATHGQAKHAVQKAYQYLEAELSEVGGADAAVTTLYTTYCTAASPDSDDLLPLSIGQLKYLAKPFYDRLNSATVDFNTSAMNPASTDIYPWTIDQNDDADLALATIGQLKFVFSFDLKLWLLPAEDMDRDSLLDTWEQIIIDADTGDTITVIADVQPEDDYDTDGLNNQSEFIQGRNPLSSDHPELRLLLY